MFWDWMWWRESKTVVFFLVTLSEKVSGVRVMTSASVRTVTEIKKTRRKRRSAKRRSFFMAGGEVRWAWFFNQRLFRIEEAVEDGDVLLIRDFSDCFLNRLQTNGSVTTKKRSYMARAFSRDVIQLFFFLFWDNSIENSEKNWVIEVIKMMVIFLRKNKFS